MKKKYRKICKREILVKNKIFHLREEMEKNKLKNQTLKNDNIYKKNNI